MDPIHAFNVPNTCSTVWPRTWQDVASVTLRDYAAAAKSGAETRNQPRPTGRTRWVVGVAVAGVAMAVALVVTRPWRTGDTYATNVGELRTVTRSVLLKPGDRLRLSEPSGRAAKGSQRVTMQMDRPHVDQLMAWRRSEAVFDDVPLSDAVAEMNRYSRQPIVVGDHSSKGLRISGLFRTGDNVAFAHAVAALHGLVVRDRQDHLELARGGGG